MQRSASSSTAFSGPLSEGAIVAWNALCFFFIISSILFCAAFPRSLLVLSPAEARSGVSSIGFGHRSAKFESMPLIVKRTVSSIVQIVMPDSPPAGNAAVAGRIGIPEVALLTAAPTLGAPSTSALTKRSNHFKPLAASARAPP